MASPRWLIFNSRFRPGTIRVRSWLQCLLGVLETLPTLLLFFRRTWRLGALLLLPVLLNVVLINFAMDLWDDTKKISATLLILNLGLLACSFPAYRSFLGGLLSRPQPVQYHPWRIVGQIAEIAIP